MLHPWGHLQFTRAELQDGVTKIGDYVFYECRDLKEVGIPEGVTGIGESAFEYCNSLSDISIPETVTHIGLCAFSGCKGLKYVISESETAPEISEEDVFRKNVCPLYVPDAAVEAYKGSTWSKYFIDIRPMSEFTTTAKTKAEARRDMVKVVDGRIETEGGHAVYDISGRLMPNGRRLPAGIYVVTTTGGQEKVMIR